MYISTFLFGVTQTFRYTVWFWNLRTREENYLLSPFFWVKSNFIFSPCYIGLLDSCWSDCLTVTLEQLSWQHGMPLCGSSRSKFTVASVGLLCFQSLSLQEYFAECFICSVTEIELCLEG